MKNFAVSFLLPMGCFALVAFTPDTRFGLRDLPNLNYDSFKIVESPKTRGATVIEAPVQQDGVKLYIAIDSDSFQNEERPGNGGIRLLNYLSADEAIDDAVRLAKGMTKKHDMFRTGFSGAKMVVNSEFKDLANIERKGLMEDTARALEALDGCMYTGCDLNTNDLDMDYLTEATGNKYVLAGRDSKVDTNIATAASVIGSILGVIDAKGENDISELTFTVQGCGKVGKTVAKELVRYGAKCVQTCDIYSELAIIQGCDAIEDWTTTPCDFLVPCANSLAITETVATNFPPGLQFCCGATNSPFQNDEARAIFDDRDVIHIPESISSAGAILADSVEWDDVELYQSVEPTLMYGWIRTISRKKATALAVGADLKASNINDVLNNVIPGRTGEPVGKDFPEWIIENKKTTDTLIIGGGLAGTATAFALGEKKMKSILVEQSETIAPPPASSNGDSRMYRQMYSNEFFSKMQSIALERWSDVEKVSGETLLHQNGLLFYGEDTGETVEGSVLGAKETMEKLNLPHTFYATGDQIADAYPALSGCRGKPYSGVREDTAGHIRASQACSAMAKAAGDSCDINLRTKIVSLKIENDNDDKEGNVIAITEDGTTIHAKKAVLACGPWTNSVLSMAGLPQLNLKIWQVQWAHYEVETEVAELIPQAFHFRKEDHIDGGLYYVFPANATDVRSNKYLAEGKTYVKVGVDFPTDNDCDIESFSYKGSKDVVKLMDEWVLEHLPQVGKRIDSFCSPYTMTDDSYFIMDKVHSKVAIFAGGSGRAFKFGPLLGDCISSLLTGDDSPVDLAPFSLQRGGLLQKTDISIESS